VIMNDNDSLEHLCWERRGALKPVYSGSELLRPNADSIGKVPTRVCAKLVC